MPLKQSLAERLQKRFSFSKTASGMQKQRTEASFLLKHFTYSEARTIDVNRSLG